MSDERPGPVSELQEAIVFLVFLTVVGCSVVGYSFRDALFPIAVPPLPVQTPRLADCRPPSELEQLHIVAVYREDRLVAHCMYVGAPAGYLKERRK